MPVPAFGEVLVVVVKDFGTDFATLERMTLRWVCLRLDLSCAADLRFKEVGVLGLEREGILGGGGVGGGRRRGGSWCLRGVDGSD